MLLVLMTEIGSRTRFWKCNVNYKLVLEELSYLLPPYTIVSISHLPPPSKQIFRENNTVDIYIFNKYLLSLYSLLSTALITYSNK